MLISDLKMIGENFFRIRKRLGMTQSEVAESAGLSDRTYADIERGNADMRVGTFIKICNVFHVSADDILVNDNISSAEKLSELLDRVSLCTPAEQETVLRLLSVYLNSLIK